MYEFYIDIFVQENDKGIAFQEVCKNFRPVVHYFFLERFLHASAWFEKRVAYTRSVEASSMVGYIVGPGDRHSMNILIDQATAHIDLGVAFEQGLMLKTTERVPFRLTRDIVDGMGITGVEGVFRRCCEETLSVMRTKKEALLTIPSLKYIFMHDPLYKWALSPLKALQRQKGIKLVDFISGPRELLLKKIIHCLEHLNLCQVDGVKELNRKRPSATAGVSFKGRARKFVKYQEESDTESEIDSEPEPADSDDEFQICQICNSEVERKKLLQCSCCKQLMHPACSVLPVTGSVSADWSCISCKEKPEEYLQLRRVYLAQKPERNDVTMEMVNINEKQSFMDGEKGGRVTIELPWSADLALQQFGRTHRSNHASAPEYRLLFGNLGGERRFASIIAKRLESLGALTQGDSRAGPSLRAYNYESPYAKRAIAELYNGIVIQSSLLVVPPGCSLEKPNTIEDFIVKGKAALVSVGLVKDDTNVGRILSA
ncbi:hypothetical protein POM88_021966 [Heracleum sosnowskyi]|uniref:PHD-type domain-containing protein n=1 Tax=Heracleum sosnowskyi TaxID=360622 RepID=A0AAD8IEX5_9APIA|nr:hypothetical protein POM88_021966 [Heracleum sosnowskyi]